MEKLEKKWTVMSTVTPVHEVPFKAMYSIMQALPFSVHLPDMLSVLFTVMDVASAFSVAQTLAKTSERSFKLSFVKAIVIARFSRKKQALRTVN